MHELNPTSTLAFLRRFRLKGGVIRRFILRNTAADSVSVKLLLTVTDTTTQEKVKLSLVIREVDEYRFQKRPGTNVFAIREVRIGTFDGITFLNLDADPADPAPKPMDYRISDCFVAGGQISWGIVRTKS